MTVDSSTNNLADLAIFQQATFQMATTLSGQRASRLMLPLLGLALLCLAVGCRSTHYRASNLPDHMQAMATHGAQGMNLSRLSGEVSGSSLLVAGDLLHLTLLSGLEEDEVPTRPARIADNGAVNVPLVGEVQVAGLDEQQATEAIRLASIERGIYRNPLVIVKVSQRAVNHITVLGAVAEPGTHPIPKGSSNLLAAIAAAGGFTEEAGTEVEVLRQSTSYLAKQPSASDSPVQQAAFNPPPLEGEAFGQLANRSERIDLAMHTSGVQQNLQLGDQDVIMIHPADKRVIHVAGLVRLPNQFEMPRDQDLHVLDAIAMAGGQSSVVADKVYVIRRSHDEGIPSMNRQPQVIEISISKAKTEGQENILLAPGDLVSVESTALTGFVDAFGKIFRISAGVGGNLLSF